MLVTSALISGLALGSMYGLLALGFYVTYAVSSTVNFAQGSSMMLGAVFAYTLAVTFGWPFVPAVLAALALCALYGMVVELVAVRPFVKRGSSAWLMATVALGMVADNAVLFTFGKEPRGFPMFQGSLQIAGIHVSWLQIAIPVVG
ncbi:MAG TPA: branched-chain amino acid ABC transporter permease, partial [Burkholderiales bacterium]|nr:branched-chain amino acid ABC transporter permease [Burkholderiales bacterium]